MAKAKIVQPPDKNIKEVVVIRFITGVKKLKAYPNAKQITATTMRRLNLSM